MSLTHNFILEKLDRGDWVPIGHHFNQARAEKVAQIKQTEGLTVRVRPKKRRRSIIYFRREART